MNTLETVADLFDPDGFIEEAYAYFAASKEQLDLARVLARYQTLPKSRQTVYLTLAALESAPAGIEVTINTGSRTYRAKTTDRSEFEHLDSSGSHRDTSERWTRRRQCMSHFLTRRTKNENTNTRTP